MKLLIVDDNQSITTMIQKYLTIKGHDVQVKNGGRDGLELIVKEKFDRILLDLSMPEFSGFDIIDSLEESQKLKEINIIVLTASSMQDSELLKLKDRGVKECLKKPVELEELNQVLQRTFVTSK